MKAVDFKLGCSYLHAAEESLPSLSHIHDLKSNRIHCVETGISQPCNGSVFYPYAEELRNIIAFYQDNGVEVWTVHLPFGSPIDISDPETKKFSTKLLRSNLRVCREMGVKKAVLHLSYEPITHDRDLHMATCVASVKELAKEGVQLAVETLPRSCLCSTIEEASARWLLSQISPAVAST